MAENEDDNKPEEAPEVTEKSLKEDPKVQCMRCVGRNKVTILKADQKEIDAHRKKEHNNMSVYMKPLGVPADIKKPE